MKLGLFPLNIVLFPDASYPLHIFEERYKTLINEVMASNSEFGINLIEDRTIRPVGCGVRVSRLLKRYEDGRMDIVVTGTMRYSIDSIHNDSGSFTTADVTFFEDDDPVPEYTLLDQTIVLYNELIESVYGESEEALNPSDWVGGGASFRIVQKSGLELAARQHLLEMRSETERLTFLRDYLNDIIPKIKQAEHIQMLIRNDGYIKGSPSEGDEV